jgi:hypothetical protein
MSCLICGATGPDVRTALVAWREPVAGRTFEAIPRCEDRAACRERCEAAGDEWPVTKREKNQRRLEEGAA